MVECFNYDVVREGEEKILRINCENCTFLPSIEDNEIVMSKTIDILTETGVITRIVYNQKRDFEYDFEQVKLLLELASMYKDIIEQKLLTYGKSGVGAACDRYFPDRYVSTQSLLNKLKEDPISAYVEIKRIVREQRIRIETTNDPAAIKCISDYVNILTKISQKLDSSKLILAASPYLATFKPGDREIYRKIFRPTIKPDFMFTKLMSAYPVDGEELDAYKLEETEVTIFKIPGTVKTLYHIIPPEFKLDEVKYEILDQARRILAEHKPTRSEFTDPERIREVFYNVGYDLIRDLIDHQGISMRKSEVEQLTEILVRYTIGFGLIEILLQDQKIQDISINSPMGQIPIFIVHADFGDCYTNIIPTKTEAESWASKLRLMSGRPLDEANPILDTELILPQARARVAAITEPLNPIDLGFSIRRHRDKPWTLPLFIKGKMIDPIAAGLISFIVDGTRTILIAGTRGSGKTSLIGAVINEIMRRYRIITIEDTLELPVDAYRNLGYNIQPMKVASALSKGSSEVSASDGIRATLRLGDSALIIGEVRSAEALSLYEAMRVGAAANTVAGTIHGDSPYGVFDRVVNDIGVPKTSFKATDIIIVANPVRSSDGLHRFRRVTQITEVRKKWEDDPLNEGAFVDLMKYNAATDMIEPTPELINGDSEILKTIGSNIKDFSGNWQAIWENIMLRANIKNEIVKVAEKTGNPELLEADFVLRCSDKMHELMEEIKEETGILDNEKIFFRWKEWVERETKKS